MNEWHGVIYHSYIVIHLDSREVPQRCWQVIPALANSSFYKWMVVILHWSVQQRPRINLFQYLLRHDYSSLPPTPCPQHTHTHSPCIPQWEWNKDEMLQSWVTNPGGRRSEVACLYDLDEMTAQMLLMCTKECLPPRPLGNVNNWHSPCGLDMDMPVFSHSLISTNI